MTVFSAYKNLFGACISFTACYGSFVGIVNLQSSLNTELGLGMTSSAIFFGLAIIVASIVPSLLHLLGAKYALCVGYGLRLIYIAVNYYPSWYTLIPGSVIGGIGDVIMWVSVEVYLSQTAHNHALSLNKSPNNLVGLFMGALIFSMKAGQVYGGLTSSIVLFTFTPNVSNQEQDNLSSCTNTEAQYAEQDSLYYILVSIYFIVTVIGVMIALLVLDSYPTDWKFVSLRKGCQEYFVRPLKNVLRVLIMWKMVLLFFLFVLAGSTTAYYLGSFSNVYISECVGVRWVGFSLTVFGIFSGIVSLVTGRLYKYVPTLLFICTSVTISLAMSFFLIFWERVPSLLVVFGLSIGWGWVDGTWHTLGETLVGVHFPDYQEAAYSLYGIGISTGYVLGFVLPIYFTTRIQLSVYIGLVVLMALLISVLLAGTSKKWSHFKKKVRRYFCLCLKPHNTGRMKHGGREEAENCDTL